MDESMLKHVLFYIGFLILFLIFQTIVCSQTTWEKPPGYTAKKVPAKTSKEKKVRGKGIMGFITKRVTKSKQEVEPKKGATVNKAAVTNSPLQDAKHQAEVGAGKLAVENAESPQKDFWLTLDDEISASSQSDGESTNSDDMSEATETSLLSKTKMTFGKLAGKITKKLNSPRDQPYNALDGTEKEPSNVTESPAALQQSTEKPSAKLDKVSSQEENPSQDAQSNFTETETAEKKEEVQVVAADNAAKATTDESTNHHHSPDTTAKVNNVEAPKQEDSPKEKKVEWRSAIDAASGRTYYYVKNTTKTTWQKPSDFKE